MNEKNFGEHFYITDVNERIERIRNGPIVGPEPEEDNSGIDAVLSDESPVEEIPADAQVETSLAGDHAIDPPGEDPSVMISMLPPLSDDHSDGSSLESLLDIDEFVQFRSRWIEIQASFMDDPRSAVQQADELVAEVTGQITRMFGNERSLLDARWKQGIDVTTEDLRMALLRYHTFFNRLVI